MSAFTSAGAGAASQPPAPSAPSGTGADTKPATTGSGASSGAGAGTGAGAGAKKPAAKPKAKAKAKKPKVAARKPANWDPFLMGKQAYSEQTLRRVRSDVRSLYKSPLPGVCIWVKEDDVTLIHALITGPFDTPYEGGFFYFVVRCPYDYPNSPPLVKLMSTGGGRVRFNPNLYQNGKVCLSILGTWPGPGWSPAQSVSSVLLSIQSLLSERPYHNEPGYEKERNPGDVAAYNEQLRHEVLRVAVVEMCDATTATSKAVPEPLRNLMLSLFPSFVDSYLQYARRNRHRDGQPFRDPQGHNRGTFAFGKIVTKLEALRALLGADDDEDDSSDEEDSDDDEDDGGGD